jgi:FdhD protein
MSTAKKTPTIVDVKIKKINLREKNARYLNDCIAVETPARIYVNDQNVITLLCLPTQLRELGIGWLLSQGIVKSLDEITDVEVKENDVKITCSDRSINRKIETRIRAAGITGIVDSACGSATEDFLLLSDRMTKPFVNSNYRVKAEDILGIVKVLNEKSGLFKLTGGTHSAAIFCEGKLVAFAEDIGRHNAVDKVIGEAATSRKVNLSNCVIASTGRQPAAMVLKASRVGIPIVASIAGPVQSGVDAATKTGVTLICFVRGEKMNVYSFPERIETR